MEGVDKPLARRALTRTMSEWDLTCQQLHLPSETHQFIDYVLAYDVMETGHDDVSEASDAAGCFTCGQPSPKDVQECRQVRLSLTLFCIIYLLGLLIIFFLKSVPVNVFIAFFPLFFLFLHSLLCPLLAFFYSFFTFELGLNTSHCYSCCQSLRYSNVSTQVANDTSRHILEIFFPTNLLTSTISTM